MRNNAQVTISTSEELVLMLNIASEHESAAKLGHARLVTGCLVASPPNITTTSVVK